MEGRQAVTATKHRADDGLMIDGRPRSFNRKPRRDRSKAKADPLQRVRAKQATEAKQSLPRKPVDPFAGIPKMDRPLTPAQRSTLAALSRDPHLNFDNWQTLTRGQADRLIPRLRKLAKRRSDAQLTKPKRRTNRGSQ
jgi:hypothetical protein